MLGTATLSLTLKTASLLKRMNCSINNCIALLRHPIRRRRSLVLGRRWLMEIDTIDPHSCTTYIQHRAVRCLVGTPPMGEPKSSATPAHALSRLLTCPHSLVYYEVIDLLDTFICSFWSYGLLSSGQTKRALARYETVRLFDAIEAIQLLA